MTQDRTEELAQLCPWPDCAWQLAFTHGGIWKCPNCKQLFYAEASEGEYEDWHSTPLDEVPSVVAIHFARGIGSSWGTPNSGIQKCDAIPNEAIATKSIEIARLVAEAKAPGSKTVWASSPEIMHAVIDRLVESGWSFIDAAARVWWDSGIQDNGGLAEARAEGAMILWPDSDW